MLENSKELLKNSTFSLDFELNAMNFEINQYPEKARTTTFDQEFIEKAINPEENTIKNDEFYVEDEKIGMIFSFDFYKETIEISNEIIEKLFEILCYSVPDMTVLSEIITKGFSTNLPINSKKIRSTYLLLKKISYNYTNFLRISRFFTMGLEEKCYLEGFSGKMACFYDGKCFANNKSFFANMHGFLSGIVINLVKKNYGANFFLLLETNSMKREISNEILKKLEENHEEIQKNDMSIIGKIFDFYAKPPDFEKYGYNFEVVKMLINVIYDRNIEKERIPEEKLRILQEKSSQNSILHGDLSLKSQDFSKKHQILSEKPDENLNFTSKILDSLSFYPFFLLEEVSDIPNSKILLEFLIKHDNFLLRKKIKVSEGFFKRISKNYSSIISLISSQIAIDLLSDFSKELENVNKLLIKNKEKLMEDSKQKALQWQNISNAIVAVNNSFDATFPNHKTKSKEFCLFVQNLIKLARKTQESGAIMLKNEYKRALEEYRKKKKKIQMKNEEIIEKTNENIIKNKDKIEENIMKIEENYIVKNEENIAKNLDKNEEIPNKNPDKFEEELLKEYQEKFAENERYLLDSFHFFFLKNKSFVHCFLQLLKVFLIVDDTSKLLPSITKSQKNDLFGICSRFSAELKAFFRIISFIELKEFDEKNKKDIDFLINDQNLPEMKRIFTKENSSQQEIDVISLEKTISSVIHKEDFGFEEVFNLIYRVQDVIQYIFQRIPAGRTPSIYRILFAKHDINKINLFLKMEYLKYF